MSHGGTDFLSRTQTGPLSVRALGPRPICPTGQSALRFTRYEALKGYLASTCVVTSYSFFDSSQNATWFAVFLNLLLPMPFFLLSIWYKPVVRPVLQGWQNFLGCKMWHEICKVASQAHWIQTVMGCKI